MIQTKLSELFGSKWLTLVRKADDHLVYEYADDDCIITLEVYLLSGKKEVLKTKIDKLINVIDLTSGVKITIV